MTNTTTAARWPLPLDNPYPELGRFRESAPVHWLSDLDAYLVVSHAAAMGVLRGAEWSSDPTRSPRLATRLGMTGMAGETIGRSLLFSDPPDHTRLRRVLRGHLAPRAVEELRPRVRAIVGAAMAECDAQAPIEVMGELAYPVPLAVICELLGAPVETAELLREETPRMVAMLDPLAEREDVEAGTAATFSVMLALVPLVAERRSRPKDDLLSALIHGTVDVPGLDVDEAITMALLLLAAGHETTANLVGNAVVALHDHPDLARLLREQPDLLPSAVEELVRFDSPVQLASRVATEEMQLGDTRIPADHQALISLGGANRDPAAFANPDSLDMNRGGHGHLAFGHGPHFCAGAALARCETEEMLRRLLELEPRLEDRGLALERDSSASFRRVKALSIEQ
jgi:cytochrome P450